MTPAPPQAQIGTMVLFCVGTAWRPLLPLAANGSTIQAGLLFLDPQLDNQEDWVAKHFFYRPTPEQTGYHVYDVRPGKKPGEWWPIEKVGFGLGPTRAIEARR